MALVVFLTHGRWLTRKAGLPYTCVACHTLVIGCRQCAGEVPPTSTSSVPQGISTPTWHQYKARMSFGADSVQARFPQQVPVLSHKASVPQHGISTKHTCLADRSCEDAWAPSHNRLCAGMSPYECPSSARRCRHLCECMCKSNHCPSNHCPSAAATQMLWADAHGPKSSLLLSLLSLLFMPAWATHPLAINAQQPTLQPSIISKGQAACKPCGHQRPATHPSTINYQQRTSRMQNSSDTRLILPARQPLKWLHFLFNPTFSSAFVRVAH